MTPKTRKRRAPARQRRARPFRLSAASPRPGPPDGAGLDSPLSPSCPPPPPSRRTPHRTIDGTIHGGLIVRPSLPLPVCPCARCLPPRVTERVWGVIFCKKFFLGRFLTIILGEAGLCGFPPWSRLGRALRAGMCPSSCPGREIWRFSVAKWFGRAGGPFCWRSTPAPCGGPVMTRVCLLAGGCVTPTGCDQINACTVFKNRPPTMWAGATTDGVRSEREPMEIDNRFKVIVSRFKVVVSPESEVWIKDMHPDMPAVFCVFSERSNIYWADLIVASLNTRHSGILTLADAERAYNAATCPRDANAAYNAVRLFGGHDFHGAEGFRPWMVRKLRQLAAWLEGNRNA
jgi:hypothetical protein